MLELVGDDEAADDVATDVVAEDEELLLLVLSSGIFAVDLVYSINQKKFSNLIKLIEICFSRLSLVLVNAVVGSVSALL